MDPLARQQEPVNRIHGLRYQAEIRKTCLVLCFTRHYNRTVLNGTLGTDPFAAPYFPAGGGTAHGRSPCLLPLCLTARNALKPRRKVGGLRTPLGTPFLTQPSSVS